MWMTKSYKFLRTKDINQLPKYVMDYVADGEKVWIVYTTLSDHGVFTDKKFILFDNNMTIRQRREIITVPYENVTSISIVFYANSAELIMYLNNGGEVIIKVIRMTPTDKMQIRYLYSCISRIINKQKLNKEDVEKLINNDFKLGVE